MVVLCSEGGVAVLHGAVGDDDGKKQSAQDVLERRKLKQGEKKQKQKKAAN